MRHHEILSGKPEAVERYLIKIYPVKIHSSSKKAIKDVLDAFKELTGMKGKTVYRSI